MGKIKKIAGVVVLGTFLLFGGVFGFQSSVSANELDTPNQESQNGEVSPMVSFSPNMYIIANSVQKVADGWWVDGYFLGKNDKEGWWLSPNPKRGKKICLMTDYRDHVVGWKVL